MAFHGAVPKNFKLPWVVSRMSLQQCSGALPAELLNGFPRLPK